MKLSLNRDCLSPLTHDELSAVQGADAPPTLQQDCVRTIFDTYQPTRCLCP